MLMVYCDGGVLGMNVYLRTLVLKCCTRSCMISMNFIGHLTFVFPKPYQSHIHIYMDVGLIDVPMIHVLV